MRRCAARWLFGSTPTQLDGPKANIEAAPKGRFQIED
jgi:hypothetical protein